VSLVLLARGNHRGRLQLGALLLGAVGTVMFGWAWLEVGTTLTLLHALVVVAAATTGVSACYGLGLTKLLGDTSDWLAPARQLTPWLAATGAAALIISALYDAFYLGNLACYAQGIALIQEASKQFDYGVHLPEVARIWKGGCIIRSKMLEPIKQAYVRDPELVNLLLDPHFLAITNKGLPALRKVVQIAAETGVPAICLGATLAYIDSYRSEFLPANLLQALRDNFGGGQLSRRSPTGYARRCSRAPRPAAPTSMTGRRCRPPPPRCGRPCPRAAPCSTR
jgi:hypothetical protein